MLHYDLSLASNQKQRSWFSGKILACHLTSSNKSDHIAGAVGSIPAGRIQFLLPIDEDRIMVSVTRVGCLCVFGGSVSA